MKQFIGKKATMKQYDGYYWHEVGKHVICTAMNNDQEQQCSQYLAAKWKSFFGPKPVCAFCDIDRDGVPTDRCLSSHGTSLLENGELE